MGWLQVLALVLNTADAANTCATLKDGSGRELNPLMPKNCAGVVAQKAALSVPMFLGPKPFRRAWTVGVMAGSGIGITISLKNR